MKITPSSGEIVNKYLKMIREDTETISEGQGVAVLLYWAMILEHATCEDIEPFDLARHQLNSFLEYIKENESCIGLTKERLN